MSTEENKALVRREYEQVYRVTGGKLAEEWVELDMLGLLQQLGAIPPMANA